MTVIINSNMKNISIYKDKMIKQKDNQKALFT
jgi:hypothetical protein